MPNLLMIYMKAYVVAIYLFIVKVVKYYSESFPEGMAIPTCVFHNRTSSYTDARQTIYTQPTKWISIEHIIVCYQTNAFHLYTVSYSLQT